MDYTSGVNNTTASYNVTVEEWLVMCLGPKHLPLKIVVPLTVIYATLFVSGVFGNLAVCIVIARNAALHTATNYYLFSLAVSDLTLLLLGLPNDLLVYWQQYPWPLGVPLCKVRALVSEMTSYTSVLTIVAFSTERYLAICHPLHSYAMSGLHRAVRIIAVLWLVSFVCASPFAVFADVNYIDYPPGSGKPLAESAFCAMLETNIPANWPIYELSGALFFCVPMIVIMVLYARIGLRIRRRERHSLGKRLPGTVHRRSHSRKAIIRMLSAVVITFFVCWAPFHLQRLLYLYARNTLPHFYTINEWLYYITGCLYYLSSTANPILYNVMSVKYRKAFRQTLCGVRLHHNDLNSSFRETLTNANDSPRVWQRADTWRKKSARSVVRSTQAQTDVVVCIRPGGGSGSRRWPKTLLRVTMSPNTAPDTGSDLSDDGGSSSQRPAEIDVEAKLCCDCDNSSSGGSLCIQMETCI